eukprot:CAMPEP_0197528276 /NCGR_PEP_ID=MMETSP1318-20131121/24550_1 /TAXON_ID=552666 /ORGANISM="Partenskyella glossopodia, Strain RCC365" /LENGTH=360 /DNA_ID=CAMNT_0043083311 /DNA_START=184 /DNA_END=1266 /DNA_ORIENTATION=-
MQHPDSPFHGGSGYVESPKSLRSPVRMSYSRPGSRGRLSRREDMKLEEALQRLEEIETSLANEKKASETMRSYQMVLERTLKQQIAEHGLDATHEQLILKNTQLEHRLENALRQVKEKEREVHNAHTINKRTAETQALTREALEAIRKQQDLGIATIEQLEGQIKTLQKQKSSLQERCTELEIKLEASETTMGETLQSIASNMNGADRHIALEIQTHERRRADLESKLNRVEMLERENIKMAEELRKIKSPTGGKGNLSLAEACRQIENRDRIIMAIKDEYDKTVARNKFLQRSIQGSKSSQNDLMDRLAVEVQRYLHHVKEKNKRIHQLEKALGLKIGGNIVQQQQQHELPDPGDSVKV